MENSVDPDQLARFWIYTLLQTGYIHVKHGKAKNGLYAYVIKISLLVYYTHMQSSGKQLPR